MDDVLETNWSEHKQLEILGDIPALDLSKHRLLGLENILSYNYR